MRSTCMVKKLGVATSTIHKHIKNLESEGIIEIFTIITDPSKLDLNITTFIGLNIDSRRRINIVKRCAGIHNRSRAAVYTTNIN